MSHQHRHLIARAAHAVVSVVVPAVVVAAATVLHMPASAGATVWWGTAVMGALFLWWEFAVPFLRRAADRWYLATAPAAEWLAYLGLDGSWSTPAPSAAAFGERHGDPASWDAAELETHQNLALHTNTSTASTTSKG
ncbi:hypothetical protein [Streptomyces syringium]|uniref:hypothetical protein n=1 Tax=Streptomyces syringium TaxID=76729 RepID=UPI003AAFA09D